MTTTTTMTEDERLQLVRYTRPERWPMLDRFPVSPGLRDSILAEVVDDDVDAVRDRVDAMHRRLTTAVADLLRSAPYRTALQRLPFRGGDRVAAFGDSLTADRLGWFDLLTRSMQLTGITGVTTHNLGLSGDTTADALERFDLLEAFRPTHVLVMLGTNDARRHGRHDDHRMVSATETGRNLAVLDELITATLGARAVFITPPPADQTRIDGFFAEAPLRWIAAELDEVAALVREVTSPHIDIHRTLQAKPTATFLDPDGVHLSLAGQQTVAALVADALDTASRPPARRATVLG